MLDLNLSSTWLHEESIDPVQNLIKTPSTLYLLLESDPILDWAFMRLGDGAYPTTILFIDTEENNFIFCIFKYLLFQPFLAVSGASENDENGGFGTDLLLQK